MRAHDPGHHLVDGAQPGEPGLLLRRPQKPADARQASMQRLRSKGAGALARTELVPGRGGCARKLRRLAIGRRRPARGRWPAALTRPATWGWRAHTEGRPSAPAEYAAIEVTASAQVTLRSTPTAHAGPHARRSPVARVRGRVLPTDPHRGAAAAGGQWPDLSAPLEGLTVSTTAGWCSGDAAGRPLPAVDLPRASG